MIDALREDFVEFPDNTYRYLDVNAPNAYRGKKLNLFKDAKRNFPDNTLLFPLASEMPTVTSVRIKSMLSGGLTTFFETQEEFVETDFSEDSVLY